MYIHNLHTQNDDVSCESQRWLRVISRIGPLAASSGSTCSDPSLRIAVANIDVLLLSHVGIGIVLHSMSYIHHTITIDLPYASLSFAVALIVFYTSSSYN
jgi:hypothetical protein